MKGAAQYSDALIIGAENLNPEVDEFIKKQDKPILGYQDEENYIDAINAFYDQLSDED
jgi:hypothetical protein